MKMRKTPWGFSVPDYSRGSAGADGSESRGIRLSAEDFWAKINSTPSQQHLQKCVASDQLVSEIHEATPMQLPPGVGRGQTSTAGKVSENIPSVCQQPRVTPKAPEPFHSFPECPPPGQGVNLWCLAAAYACNRYGLSPDAAISLIRDKISRNPKGGEIERAVGKAYRQDTVEREQHSIVDKYVEAELRALAHKVQGWSVEDLKNVSPVDVSRCSSLEFLRHVFKIQEKVIIATRINDRGTIWLNDPSDPNSREDELDSFKNPPEEQGAWFLSNPVTGDAVRLERLKTPTNPHGESLRAEENLTSFKYLVLESDEAPEDLWLSALVQLPLPIVSIVSSGGKSLHALIRIDAVDGDHWRAIKQRIGPALVTLGADKSALTAVRLTRLPGSYRKEKERWQELLYLNPNADETPICQLPVRAIL